MLYHSLRSNHNIHASLEVHRRRVSEPLLSVQVPEPVLPTAVSRNQGKWFQVPQETLPPMLSRCCPVHKTAVFLNSRTRPSHTGPPPTVWGFPVRSKAQGSRLRVIHSGTTGVASDKARILPGQGRTDLHSNLRLLEGCNCQQHPFYTFSTLSLCLDGG